MRDNKVFAAHVADETAMAGLGQRPPTAFVATAQGIVMFWGPRKAERVTFANGLKVHLMAIDGTWRGTCEILDVSSTGARLLVEESIEGLQLKEFFLLLSSTGLVYRRCEMVRVNGEEIGIRFLEEKKRPKSKQSGQDDVA